MEENLLRYCSLGLPEETGVMEETDVMEKTGMPD